MAATSTELAVSPLIMQPAQSGFIVNNRSRDPLETAEVKLYITMQIY